MILKAEGPRVRERLRGIRQTIVGGEPVPQELTEGWEAESGHSLLQIIGTTEMFHIFLSPRWGIDPPRPTSAGRPVPGYQVVVRDRDSFSRFGRTPQVDGRQLKASEVRPTFLPRSIFAFAEKA